MEKYKFACKQVEWLGYTINSEDTTPLKRKSEAIEKLPLPKTFKQLRSVMGSIQHLTRYIPNLAQTAVALRPLLKNTLKHKPINWKSEPNKLFENIKKLVSEITQNKYFDQHLETRIVTDASTSGLGASLEQYSPEGWVAITYASRFLNYLEEKYLVNELE